MGDESNSLLELQRFFKDAGEADYEAFEQMFGTVAKDIQSLIKKGTLDPDRDFCEETPEQLVDKIILELAKMRTPLYKALNTDD